MEEKLKKCEQEKKEYLAGWKRAKADLINYKKEEQERMGELTKYIEQEFIAEIILVLDNIELAENKTPDKNEWSEGFSNIKKQILALLKKKGVQQIEVKKGQEFDPNFQEAIEMVEGDGKSGTISEVVKKGYLLGDKVIKLLTFFNFNLLNSFFL